LDKKSSPKQWECSCDIELTFIDLDINDLITIVSDKDHHGYSIVNKSHIGWGSVISSDEDQVVDRRKISDLINSFLLKFDGVVCTVKDSFPPTKIILRVGIYYNSFTFTLPLNIEAISQMERSGIEVEVSLYPSSNQSG